MIYLLTRPFVWLFKTVKKVVTTVLMAPYRTFRARRDRRARKDAKFAAQAIREQQKAAKNPVS